MQWAYRYSPDTPAAMAVHASCNRFWRAYASLISRRRRMVLRTVAAAVVLMLHAPPATFLLQALHSQTPTTLRLTVSLPQKEQV